MNAPVISKNRPIPATELPPLGTKWFFVGIDLAPNESLETGVAVLDRQRNLTRMDKIYTDDDILLFLNNLGPANNLIVALDMPKSLSIPGRWRQEEIKMHPLRLARKDAEAVTDRYAKRATDLFEAIAKEQGILCFLYYNYLARMRYDLIIPYRNRTPQGCRALQSLIRLRLGIPNVPTNLAPSSVLDAMIGAYAAWSLYKGKDGQHFRLFEDPGERMLLEPIKRAHG
jgi:hypothetical protein